MKEMDEIQKKLDRKARMKRKDDEVTNKIFNNYTHPTEYKFANILRKYSRDAHRKSIKE